MNVAIITPGRTGSSVLMRMLSKCGVPTGYSVEDFKHGQSGYEGESFSQTVSVVKSTMPTHTLISASDEVLVLLRDPRQSSKSRLRIGAGEDGGPNVNETETHHCQAVNDVDNLTKTLKLCIAFGKPSCFLAYPDFLSSSDASINTVSRLFGVSREAWADAFTCIVSSTLIHDYENPR